MPKVLLPVLFLSLPLFARAQYPDNIWLAGYGGGSQSTGDTTFGISVLDFSDGNLSITNNQVIEMNFQDTNASICDPAGQLLFYFNGIYLEDASFETMQNGDELNDWNLGGYDLPQGGLFLPDPTDEQLYYLLHAEEGFVNLPGWNLEVLGLYYSLIDRQENGGLGGVILKKEPLILDTLEYGKLTATRHANGRDWWIVVNESHSNRYYKLLLDPSGLHIDHNQTIGAPTSEGLGQAVFSPDGRFYVKYNGIDAAQGSLVDIYRFDRCNGQLSEHLPIQLSDPSSSGGAAIAPNSRFLYIALSNTIYQFDLWANDIAGSKTAVAEYDGFTSPFPTQFYQLQLAADGKIYGTCPAGVNVLHVIHQPNLPGLECQVEQHGILLPTFNSFAAPNFPNYRLGSIDGSACDTLGINNIPLAAFRYEPSPTEPFLLHFTELAHYEPTDWYWDFGDGITSTEKNPSHLFEAGQYEVCLTVSNDFGNDTKCQTIDLGVSRQSGTLRTGLLEVACFPNPAHTTFHLLVSRPLRVAARLLVLDQLGRVVRQFELPPGAAIYQLPLGSLVAGPYICTLWQGNRLVWTSQLQVVQP